ncbi:hypothetical protein BGW36DRAFT_421245 [Talaromyces proteolyticus]|uniref:FAD-binding domain-containing protein n=1 Tax=Talaromyces proteolyticus TaxID=1131652 RepID=A0AAD4KE55_9EURO|nr:uncharacterized protein BGW36DRAFT_421245 [Talaromyces proteolyticus]KAH8688648.1 hypothetical protein BGW36DRAFT_421245 [Talaromyces proteolyticus]
MHDASPSLDGPSNLSLKILIVGGGIGGLTAAIALREQGHEVDIYEQSQFANEVGAAIHIVPNANSVLQRLGIMHEEEGAIRLRQTRFFKSTGELLSTTNNEADSYHWQKPWLLAHRAHLHSHLKRVATSTKGRGPPARLHTSSRIITVDPLTATIKFTNGDQAQGDLIVGADGVHSRCRLAIAGPEYRPQKSDRSAFRFMVPTEAVLADPETRSLAEVRGSMDMYYAVDRKAVIYPCAHNTLLNFVCLHPAALSDASAETYDKTVRIEALLHVYKEFSPQLLKVFQKCDPESLKVYPLFDVETLPTFINDRLVLIGDAAHPFTPHLAQGGAMAIEDAVSLGVMLSKGVTSVEVPERLRLYNKARYGRATAIQNFSRIVGNDVFEYINYGLSHDEHDASTQVLREHQWSQCPKLYWRQPTVFGPMPGPRQDFRGNPEIRDLSTTRTARITFKTSATLLRNMLPSKAYSFAVGDTVATASLSVQSLNKLDWLGGGSYDLIMFQIHGVKHTAPDGSVIHGRFCPVLFENLADPILSGREELGWPKLFSEIDIQTPSENSYEVTVAWRGAKWASFWLHGLRDELESNKDGKTPTVPDDGLLVHKFLPTTTDQPHQSKADSNYDVFIPDLPAKTTTADTNNDNSNQSSFVPTQTSCQVSSQAGFRIFPLGQRELPTLYHIVDRLAEVPIFEVTDARLWTEQGVRNLSDARRIG